MMTFRAALLLLSVLGGSLAAQPAGLGPRTTIDSDALEMQGTEESNFFFFRGNVHVLGTDLEIRCDELTVSAQRGGDSAGNATVGEIGAIEKIVARGGVRIVQAGREASAGRVEVDPVAGTIKFLENPVIVQGETTASAYGFVFYTQDKRLEAIADPAFVAGEEGTARRPTITLPKLPKMTFDLPKDDVTVDKKINQPVSGETPGETPGEDPSEASTEATPPEEAPAAPAQP